MNEIKLGYTCTDKVTGYTGTAMCKLETLNGNVQYSIIPKVKPDSNEYPTGINLDAVQLIALDAGISADTKPAAGTEINIGEKVTDIITAMSGIVIYKWTYLNGCVYFTVLVKHAKKDPFELFVPVERLERISSGIAPKIFRADKPTGGPSIPARRAC